MQINMELYETEHFRIYNQNESMDILKDIEKTLDSTYVLVQNFYDIKLEKTDVYVFSNQVKFQQLRDPTINENNKIDWWVWETMDKDILVVSPSLKINGHNYQSILGVFAHEFVHTINNRINKDCNIWINEGVALYLTNGYKSKDILKYYKIPCIEIFNINDQRKFAEDNGYIFADKFIEYVNEKYINGKVLELIKDNDYEKILEKKLEIIYKEWIKYLEENYG